MRADRAHWRAMFGPFASAIGLHAVLGFVLLVGFSVTTPSPDSFVLPPVMQASLRTNPTPKTVASEPRPTPKPAPTPEPAPTPQPTPAPEPAPKPAATPKPEPQPAPAPTSRPAPVTTFDDLLAGLDSEDAAIEQQQEQLEQRREEQVRIGSVTDDYKARIGQQVQRSWSRPMELRIMDLQGKATVVRINLLPTGELQGEPVIERSSGIDSLDQSALRALQRVRRFEVPADSQVFNQNFRSFTITFKPEDLMQ